MVVICDCIQNEVPIYPTRASVKPTKSSPKIRKGGGGGCLVFFLTCSSTRFAYYSPISLVYVVSALPSYLSQPILAAVLLRHPRK